MKCSVCGCEYDGRHCPNCTTSLLPAKDEKNRHEYVADAEVVDDTQSTAYDNRGTSSSYQFFRFDTSDTFQGSSKSGIQQLQFSALPITLIIMTLCAFQYGILAAIGFLFFYGIAAAIGMFVIVGRMLNGFAVNPWMLRICNWIICYMLVGWLAK